MENESNTPDFILAEYLRDCMTAYALALSKRDKWKGYQYVNPDYITTDGMHKIGVSPEDFVGIKIGPPPTSLEPSHS